MRAVFSVSKSASSGFYRADRTTFYAHTWVTRWWRRVVQVSRSFLSSSGSDTSCGNAMTELAKEAFTSRNYHLAVEMYERCLKQQSPSYEVLLGYGDSLAACGRVRESIEIYSRCLAATSMPAERLKHLATALLDDMTGAGTIFRRKTESSFACPMCEGTLCQPVTIGCGHTYCRNCVDPTKNCRVCGVKIVTVGETNVLVQRLVERWWPREMEASRARHEGDILVRQGHLSQALERYNLAVHLGK